MKKQLIILLLIFATIYISCHKKDKGPREQPSKSLGGFSFSLSSIANLVKSPSGTTCSVLDGATQGKCYTPYNLSGVMNKVNLISSVSGKSARVLGAGVKYHGLDNFFRQSKFDLNQTLAFDGDDNLQANGQQTYSTLALDTKFLEITLNVMGKFIHVRYMFVDQSPTLSASLSNCSLGVSVLNDVAQKGLLWTGATGIYAGDILACVKSTNTEVCADSDYQWIDSSTGALSSSRGTPLKLTGAYAMENTLCTNAGGYPEIIWGGMYLYSQLNNAIALNAALDGGRRLFTSGSSSGHSLDTTLQLDSTESLFVPTSLQTIFESQNYNADGSTLLKNLDKITLRQIYEYNNRTTAATAISATSMIRSDLVVSITEKESSEDGDGNH